MGTELAQRLQQYEEEDENVTVHGVFDARRIIC